MRPLRTWARCLVGLGLAASAALGTRSAAAEDAVNGSRSTDLVERDHAVTVEVDRGHARLVVRRTVHNGGARHDQATFWIEVPEGAVATGLRSLGTLDGQPHWFAADLLEAEAAAAKYRELTGVGGFYPKDPALLSWIGQTQLALQVFPVAPKDDKTIEYTLVLPTEYRGGRDHLALPRMGTEGLAAVATVRGEGVLRDGKPLAPGARVKLDGPVDLAAPRAGGKALGGALAVVPFGKGRVLLRQRIEAAPRLGEVPRGARVVVLIDASRSLDDDTAAAEVAAARAYLSHFADAEVETLLFDRRVTSLHNGFVPVTRALDALGRLSVARRNGSNVDDALARAAALFTGLPAKTPRRVVLFTDTRTRASLGPDALRAIAARTGAVVHVGVVQPGKPELARDEDHPWAKIARSTGGVVWEASASADTDDAAAMRAAYEELARPMRVDRLRVTAPGLDRSRFEYPERLDEGGGFADLRVVDRQIGWIKVEGELWSRPISTVLVPDEDEGRLAAALVFGSPALHELAEPEMAPLAKLGHAVTPVTSFLAIEPGVRPSTEGLEPEIGLIGGSFSSGCLGLSGIGTGGSGYTLRGDLLDTLKGEIAPAWKACGGAGKKARVAVETTLAEVVDVSDARILGGEDPTLARCLAEAAWSLELPPFFRDEHRTFVVDL